LSVKFTGFGCLFFRSVSRFLLGFEPFTTAWHGFCNSPG
jgi:hypothetical protein